MNARRVTDVRAGLCVAAALGWLMACSGSVLDQSAPEAAGGHVADASIEAEAGSSGGAGAAGGAGGSAGVGGSAGQAGEAGAGHGGSGGMVGPPVRTVIVRDVFRDLDVSDNLMADGGFEFSGDMSMTWGPGGYAPMKWVNGAKCRNGIRCASFSDDGIYGFFASPQFGTLRVVMQTKTDAGDCPDIDVYVLDIYSQAGVQMVNMNASHVGPDGWCEMVGTMPAQPYKAPVLYMMSQSGEVVIDDVVVRRAGLAPTNHAVSIAPAMKVKLNRVAALAHSQLERRRPPLDPKSGAPKTARFQAWLR